MEPGSFATAADIMRGLDHGLSRFKFFPAETSGGLPALKALSGPFGQVRFCPTGGIDAAKADEIVRAAGFDADTAPQVAAVLQQLGKVYEAEDATLVEVNPLIKTGSGDIVALDGKVTLDDNAAFRHPDHAALADTSAEDPLEAAAKAKGLNYVKLDGSVGIIGNGAGLVMSTLDVVAYAGEGLPGKPRPANFLDIGGGASAEVMANGLEIILGDAQVKSVFVNVFGGSPPATRWPTASCRPSRCSSPAARP